MSRSPRRALTLDVSGTDEEGVQISQHHHQILASCRGTVQLLVVGLIGLDSDSDWAVRSKHRVGVANSVYEDVLVALQNDHRLSDQSTAAAELQLEFHLASVGSDLKLEGLSIILTLVSFHSYYRFMKDPILRSYQHY